MKGGVCEQRRPVIRRFAIKLQWSIQILHAAMLATEESSLPHAGRLD
jgi:hypothetical protein